MDITIKWGIPTLDVLVDSLCDANITADIDNLASDSLEMKDAFWVFAGWYDNFDIFGESFRKPECYICFLSSLLVSKSINSFYHNNNLMIDLLRAINNLLFLNLRAHYIQPIGKELAYVFLKEIDILLQLQGFL